jgi:hypothetical protein
MKKLYTLLAALILIVLNSSAQTLTTDLPDYPPGATVILTGTGFQPGETVRLDVVHADGGTWEGDYHVPWYVIADSLGNFVTTWYVQDCDNIALIASADGLSSGLHAEVYFTDGNT